MKQISVRQSDHYIAMELITKERDQDLTKEEQRTLSDLMANPYIKGRTEEAIRQRNLQAIARIARA